MVGRHEALNADQARQWSTFIIMRIREGDNLAPLPLAARFNGGPTVSDLAERCPRTCRSRPRSGGTFLRPLPISRVGRRASSRRTYGSARFSRPTSVFRTVSRLAAILHSCCILKPMSTPAQPDGRRPACPR